MNSFISSQASANGWAYFDLNTVLAKGIANRGPYSVVKQLTCLRPYGQYVSLDGVHPNGKWTAARCNRRTASSE